MEKEYSRKGATGAAAEEPEPEVEDSGADRAEARIQQLLDEANAATPTCRVRKLLLEYRGAAALQSDLCNADDARDGARRHEAETKLAEIDAALAGELVE